MKRQLVWLQKIRAGGAVRRYHTVPVHHNQSVAAHSWGVAVMARYLDPACDLAVVLAALYHDVAEAETGDTPANVKWRAPAIDAALTALELEVEMELGIVAVLDDDERELLKAADMAETLLYCLEERRLGNRNMDIVVDRAADSLRKRAYIDKALETRVHGFVGEVLGEYRRSSK